MEVVVNPWYGRRVFLTGHTGFKGGWLALSLAAKGAVIRGYSLDPATKPNLFTSAAVATILDDQRGDIRDYRRLQMSLEDFGAEIVFHLAAQPLVRRSYGDPLETLSTNIIGTANLLEAVRQSQTVRAVVCVTSDKCYENQETGQFYRESDRLGGHDPYSASKACAEIVAAAYRDSYFLSGQQAGHRVGIATARAGNVIGGGDWSEDRLIPDLIRGFNTGKPVPIRHPNAIRPWQHVLEPLQGYMLLGEQLLAGQTEAACAFNFGPNKDDCWSVGRIATTFAEMWGPGASWCHDTDRSVQEADCLTLDSTKSRRRLGWHPNLDLHTALEWTMRWYRQWQAGPDVALECRAQIAAYERLDFKNEPAKTSPLS